MKSLTQLQISTICEKLATNISGILNYFNIEYLQYPNRYSFCCPIHGGDNKEGCSIFTDGDSFAGNWKCWTKQCEEKYANNIFGFIRGALSYKHSKNINLHETYKFCLEFLKINENDVICSRINDNKDIRLLDIFLQKSKTTNNSQLTREQIRSKLDIPGKYYLQRGFSKEILDEFDVGLCLEYNKPMYNRVVVPIYDQDYNYVGCVGRTMSEYLKPKWLHSKGFKKEYLYGYNIAKNYITKDTIFILEGQGDVWRMHEAGYKNSVSIFGASLTDEQLIILEESGALNLVILTDYDEAGHKAAEQIIKKCGRRFNYFRPNISKKDIGEMEVQQLKLELEPQLKEVGL